ncbi:MAG: ABC transporter ATP-binding protein [Alphaproteobacteria bacterium]|nr:ABC transporter ATP-binding protein [Alphaproteobacteria bacterium]
MIMLEAETTFEEAPADPPDLAERPDEETVVEVHDVSKKFARSLKRSLFYAARDLGRELACKNASTALRKDEFWALEGISFSLKKGEAIGIIGPNGAGKSTLLKIINGIIKPTTGHVRTLGRVQALIELSAGMNPILSGRENIYIRAMLLGLAKSTIDARIDDIIAFAELEEFIDMPVQNYSSGMRVKLGFSIAINVDPDILILDEVLAVGDQRFRAKARDAMTMLLRRKVALIFISHNMNQVMSITDRAIWIDRGRERGAGPSRDVCSRYLVDQQRTPSSLGRVLAQPMSRSAGYLSLDAIDIDPAIRRQDEHLIFGGESEATRLTFTLTFSRVRQFADEKIYYTVFVSQSDAIMTAYKMLQDTVDASVGSSFKRTFQLDLSMYNPGAYQLGLMVQPENEMSTILYGTHAVLQFVVEPQEARAAVWERGRQHERRMIYNSLGAVVLPIEICDDETGPHG